MIFERELEDFLGQSKVAEKNKDLVKAICVKFGLDMEKIKEMW